ncbi:MAG: DUF1670 domain-containing protein [Bacteroidetes bacterium]|nr:DUF1670 domain-containing protein [Bacteroidota bacterium]MBU2472026.1 DUF1670 domain-containing protein [Bacteroidota bacterium]
MVTVLLTLDAGEEDLRLKEQKGVAALRQHRIERLCHEAYQQGGLLTVEDLVPQSGIYSIVVNELSHEI